MKPDDVLAVVVSFNGLGQIRETVTALRGQVGHVYVVDNGSGAESLGVLDALEQDPGVSVERLGENRGVGYALNRGVERARQMGFAWLLTMDQDSVVDSGLIRAYAAAIARDPSLVCLSPRIVAGAGAEEAASRVVAYAITSGNLVRGSLFNEIGLYDEGFFVDCIDFDFCLRLRRAGYVVYRESQATMQHQLGEVMTVPTLAGRFYARHSPVRRYYMSRNFMYLMERYLARFPAFIVKLAVSYLILAVFIGFLDTRPLASYRAAAHGVRDWMFRRLGPMPEGAR